MDPHSKTGPLQALETAPPPLLPRGPFTASHIQAKARRALSRNRRACDGPRRGCPGRPAGKRTCLLRLPCPPTWCCQNVRGFSSVPSSSAIGVGPGRPASGPHPQTPPSLLCLDLCISSDFLRTQTKRWAEGIRVPGPLAGGGSTTARRKLRLCARGWQCPFVLCLHPQGCGSAMLLSCFSHV